MADCFIGEIRMFAGKRAPVQWFLCQGQLLKIAEYQALYSLIGTTYGGDGVNTFALPNLNGRVPVGMGQGTGLTSRAIGQTGGSYHATLDPSTMPPHTHVFNTTNVDATTSALNVGGSGLTLANAVSGSLLYVNNNAAGSASVTLSDATVASTGSGAFHENVMPCGVVNFIIATAGEYPQQA